MARAASARALARERDRARARSPRPAPRHRPAAPASRSRLSSTVSTRAAMRRGDHRPAHRLRLDDDAAEALGLGRGRDHDIGQHVGRRHVAAVVEDAESAPARAARDMRDRARCDSAALPVPTSRQWTAGRSSRTIASIRTSWPFQRVSRPGSMTTGTPSGRRHSRAQLDDALGAGRARDRSASKSTPRVDDAEPLGAARHRPRRHVRATKSEMAMTRSPRAITEL